MNISGNKGYEQNCNYGKIFNADQIIVYYNDASGNHQEISIHLRELCNATLKNQLETQAFRYKATEKGCEISVYVPLGLEERKEQPRLNMLGNLQQRNVQQRNVHQPKKEVISRIYEHDEFLQQVIGQTPTGANKDIAIIGEPGAGKTTLLGAIASFILNRNSTPPVDRGENSTENLAIFISLASLEKRRLDNYLREIWLVEAMRLVYPEVVLTKEVEEQLQHQLMQRFKEGGVWLLLDGVDEMSLDSSVKPLDTIQKQLTSWLTQARVVLTCRLNVWDAKVNNPLSGFDTYKTQDLKPGDIDKFIEEWFACANLQEHGEQLQEKLKKPGKAQIRELIKNPLRLSLLCQIFYIDKQAELPKTKAGLYQKFVRYFYEWKSNDIKNKQELPSTLAELALEGMKTESRYSLSEQFGKKIMGEDLFKLACDVGWLNLVNRDTETDEAVYAFFHTTFQEYFAAYAIEDWDFFLPSEHIDRPVKGKSYRIFEPQWKEVVLFWLGRNDVEKKKKEKFLNALVSFKDGCNDFYFYKAYFLAAIGIAEFQEYFKDREIVEQLAEWINIPITSDETKEAIQQAKRSYIISDEAKEAIQQTKRSQAITTLVELINQSEYKFSRKLEESSRQESVYFEQLKKHYSRSNRIEAASILGTIDKGNSIAIDTLFELISTTPSGENFEKFISILETIDNGGSIDRDTQFESIYMRLEEEIFEKAISSLVKIGKDVSRVTDFLVTSIGKEPDGMRRWHIIETLGELDKENPIVMNVLDDLIDESRHQDTRWIAAKSLLKIDNNNPRAIDALIDLIYNSCENTPYQAIVTLGEIAKNNSKVIAALGNLIDDKSQAQSLRYKAAINLIKIDRGNSKAIDFLLHFMNQSQDEYARIQAAVTLVEVDENSKAAIDFLLHVMNNSYQNEELRCIATESLGKIDKYNSKSTAVLVDLIKNAQNSSFRNKAANSLEEIGKDSPIAIDALVELIRKPQNKDIPREVVSSLGKIGKDNPKAIAALVQLIHSQFESIHLEAESSLWNCVQNTLYPEFYQFWQQGRGSFVQQLWKLLCTFTQKMGRILQIVTSRYLQKDTLPPHRLHLESLAGMSHSDADKLLNGLEATEQKFRENILAQTLLDTLFLAQTLLNALEPEEQKFLARLSVFNLPVTEEIVRAISTANELAVLSKLTSLSLVESTTTQPNQLANYRVTTILEPLLEPVLTEEEWQSTRQQAVRKIHQLWWEESENKPEAQALEIVRLGLLAKEKEIAVSVGNTIARRWIDKSYRFSEAFKLCQQILAIYEDYRIMTSVARSESILGLVEDAAEHFQRALELCPQEDLQEKGIILHNMGSLYHQKGEFERALEFYEQSLQIHERINNVHGKASNLHNMGSLYHQKGEFERALEFYEQSLQMNESINDMHDKAIAKATTLHQIATLYADKGENERALELYEQSLQINESSNNVPGKAENLNAMAVLYLKKLEIDRALELNAQSFEINTSINNIVGINNNLKFLDALSNEH